MSELSEEDVIKYLEECNESQDILGFCYIPEMVCSKILDLYQKEKEKNNKILELAFQYGQIDGEHHKTWVIDQIVRILTENDYDKWVQHYEYDEEIGEDYTWDIGIAP